MSDPQEIKLLLEEVRASEECGCPEEVWLVGHVETTIHVEPNGHIHCIMDAGDQQAEMTFHDLPSLDVARDLVLGWAKAMLFSNYGWA